MSESSLQCFDFNAQQVRVIIVGFEPWFIAQDICKALDLGNVSQACTVLKDREKQTINIKERGIILNDDPDTLRLVAISESGLYRLTMRSRKPQAEPFQDWVCEEVLPAIRITGRYGEEQPMERYLPSSYIEALKALVVAEEEKLQLQEANQQLAIASAKTEEESKSLKAEIIVLAPKAESFDVYVNSDGWLNGEQIAKQMAIPKLSVRKLYDILREEKVIFKRAGDGVNIPCQKWVDQGLAKLRDIKCPDSVMRRGLVFHRKAFDRILDVLRDRGLVPSGRDYAIVLESNVIPLKRAEA